MKILFGPNHMKLENGIPEFKKTYPDVEFIHCAKPEDAPTLIADADVYIGWLNRDLFLAAKSIKWIQSSEFWGRLFCFHPRIGGERCPAHKRKRHPRCVCRGKRDCDDPCLYSRY